MNAAVNTFAPYKDKSSAKRGFGRAFKDFAGSVDHYLDQVEGQWGFYKDADGKPVPTNVTPVQSVAAVVGNLDLNVINDMAPKSVIADQELAAAVEESSDAPPAPDAFSRFALNQLGGAPQGASVAPAAPAAPALSNTKKDRAEANGVKRPAEGTICSQVWDIATSLSNPGDENRVAKLMEVVKAAEAVGINKFTARTQYARWRVFHGVTGRGK